MGWFDEYPAFRETSQTGVTLNRLNLRYAALIAANTELVRGQRVLDIASHDGRWSFAALGSGARHVTGIEARPHLVTNAKANMARYGVSEDRYHFVLGDVHEEIRSIEPGSIDTVFLFGFLYHTIHHMSLLSAIQRLRPKRLIVDTAVWPSVPVGSIYSPDSPYVRGRGEDPSREFVPLIRIEREPAQGNFEGEAVGEGTVVGYPNREALELLLSASGFNDLAYFDWHEQGIKNWEGALDYKQQVRLTVVAR